MSKALFKKSLEIFERKNVHDEKKKKATAFDIMPENHKLIKTIKKQGKKKQYNELKAKHKLTVEEAKEILDSQKDKTEDNVAKLIRLSSNSMKTETADKIFRRAKLGHYVIPETKPVEKSTSMFSDEDFRNFEKDYFCGS